ncbi:hypothetical protein [Antrihabitans spumae]|uniref:Uncharacterized protein n=1 Tax=Antrihabitans spumae TaxID=3373370 RepID=A0ABW7K153_9NOCA
MIAIGPVLTVTLARAGVATLRLNNWLIQPVIEGRALHTPQADMVIELVRATYPKMIQNLSWAARIQRLRVWGDLGVTLRSAQRVGAVRRCPRYRGLRRVGAVGR